MGPRGSRIREEALNGESGQCPDTKTPRGALSDDRSAPRAHVESAALRLELLELCVETEGLGDTHRSSNRRGLVKFST